MGLGTVALLAAAGFFFWPRTAHLRDFDPPGVARLETAMWREYYEHHYASLFLSLYRLSREQYGFSPWDSVRLSYYAAKAAAVFQPTRSRVEAQQARRFLRRYYEIVRGRSSERFDADRAARLELEWWQMRRENARVGQWSAAVAAVSAEVYGVSNDAVRHAAEWRAQMMQYRDDRRDLPLRPDDWAHIEEGLNRSYEFLKTGLAGP